MTSSTNANDNEDAQNNAKENFEELPQQELPKKLKTENEKKDLQSPDHNAIQNGGPNPNLVKEVPDDEMCYELKRNRDKIYR